MNDSLSKPVQSKVSSPINNPHKKKPGKRKNKRQIPVPGDRQSICNIENPQIIETSRENIETGDILRQRRLMEDSESSLSELAVAITATSVAAAILSKSKKIYRNIDVSLNKDSSNKDNSPIVISDLSKSGQQTGGLLQLQEGWKKAEQRLSKTGFFFSLTQPITPSDGNCMFHSLADQLVRLDPGTPYNCHKSVRSAVVLNLLEQLETERIIWINEDEPIEDWLDRMREFGEFRDEYCLQIFSNLIGRNILYIPVFEISAHICKQYCLIRSDNRVPYSAPLTLLWFEETFFQSGHYQSISPTDSSIIMKHYNRMNNSTYRLFESQVVRMTLRSVNSDVEQIQQPEIHSFAIMQVPPTLLQERLDQNKPSTQCRTKRKSTTILGNMMKNILI